MSWFYTFIALCFIDAIANLGVVGYLLALLRDPETVKHQYYIYTRSARPDGLSPMYILPEKVLEGGLWLTLVTSAITIIDVPIMAMLWRRVRAETIENLIENLVSFFQ